ncbi:hypothetical protein Pen02_81160 [Plantactinospora endophytica]|uniref:DUF3040 domain-containing protein n=2 Tax=Plantactinospora endophytica TaxID=673535 RepID=A0ABQ4EEN9_9ACTN|nr:hypothetical protein Pen02_81160 [Plantactinospora endophytica]
MFVVEGRRFPVAELSHLQTARGPHESLWATVMALAVALAFAATLTWRGLGGIVGAGLGGAATFVALGAVLMRRRRPRTYELWGMYRCRTVLLFVTADERRFGQVARALIRAREVARLQRPVPRAPSDADQGTSANGA